MRNLRIAFLGVVLAVTNVAANNAGTLFIEPWYEGRTPDSLYIALDRLAAIGVIEAPLMCPRPYSRGYIVELLSEGYPTDIKLAPADERYLNLLKDEFADELGVPEDEIKRPPVYKDYEGRLVGYVSGYGVGGMVYEGSDDSYGKIGGAVFDGIRYQDWLAVTMKTKAYGYIGRKNLPDRISRTKVIEMGSSGLYFESNVVYLSVGWPNLSFQFGRDHLETGPGYHNQLMLSRNAPPLDMFRFTLAFPNANYTGVTARLEPWNNRYLSFHQVTIRVTEWLDIGAVESVIYQDDDFFSVYSNPFLPFYIEQHFRGDKDNMLLGAQLKFRLPKSIQLYGEYLTDGGFIARDRSKEPFDRRGVLGGAYFPLTVSKRSLDIRCEYSNVRNTVYGHKIDGNSFTFDGTTLGSYTGSDADELWLWGGFRYWPNIETSAEFIMRRKGEGDYSPNNYYSTEKFLTGIVEKEKNITFGVLWEDLPLNGAIHSKVGYTMSDNFEHIENNQRNYFWADLQVKLGFE